MAKDTIKTRAKRKEWKKIALYFVPVIALMIGAFTGIENVASIEESLTGVIVAVFGLATTLGIVGNNDKKESNTTRTGDKLKKE